MRDTHPIWPTLGQASAEATIFVDNSRCHRYNCKTFLIQIMLNLLLIVFMYMYTSYLSRAPWAVPVEKNLSCGEICPHDRWSGGVNLHMTCGKKSVMWRNIVYNVWCFVTFYAILLPNLFFVIDNVLSRFTRFCVEKKLATKLCPWRKNDKYKA